VPLIIVNILEGRELPVYGDGRNVRDWLHVSDHCRGIELVLTDGRPGEVYNIGGYSECENIALVRLLCGIADALFSADPSLAKRFPKSPAAAGASAQLIRFVPDRLGHDRRYAIDCSKARLELNFRPGVSTSEGLLATFRWTIANEPWWRR
jgi:dTDP-glucose 4,6-dehydratase